MPSDDLESRIRLIERAIDLKQPEARRQRPDLATKFELAEKNVDLIVKSGALDTASSKQFNEIAGKAIRDSMRESLRGGAGEIAATVNVTVAGTGTVSVT